jgi:hypothetical protein
MLEAHVHDVNSSPLLLNGQRNMWYPTHVVLTLPSHNETNRLGPLVIYFQWVGGVGDKTKEID